MTKTQSKMSFAVFVILCVACVVLASKVANAQGDAASVAKSLQVSDLDLSRAIQMWDRPHKNKSVLGNPIRIAGREFESGFGTHSVSRLFVHLDGNAKRFVAYVGVDDDGPGGSVVFNVIGDGKTLWTSELVQAGEKAKHAGVDVSGIEYLTLEVRNGGDDLSNDHADWADARFEEVTGPIKVVERLPSDQGKFVPGAAWRDTDGNLIQAHGGSIMAHDGKYYWYGEDRSKGYVAIGTSAYVSDDLLNWKHLGVVLKHAQYSEKWKELAINERPKVVYNPATKKFVMWFHWDRASYWDSQAGVAIADRPEGPFKFLGAHRPIKDSTFRDMSLFVDDDGHAYVVYAGDENYTMYIVQLNEDWTAPEQPMIEGKTWIRTLVRAHREAPAPFKFEGKYYMITSAATGWAPNAATYATADDMLGEWKQRGNPCAGEGREITFGSQSTAVIPMPGVPGRFIYMGDRWSPWDLADARYVWLPMRVEKDGSLRIEWSDSWELGVAAEQ